MFNIRINSGLININDILSENEGIYLPEKRAIPNEWYQMSIKCVVNCHKGKFLGYIYMIIDQSQLSNKYFYNAYINVFFLNL